jgi:hypothetical protein
MALNAPNTQTWHADESLLATYVEGRLDAVVGASLERHLDHCHECRAAIRPLTDLPGLDRAWDGIRTGIESPRSPWLVRQGRRLGLPESTSVLLAATVSLRTAWISSALVVLAFAAATAALASGGTLWPYLLIAPLIPVLGVAAAYGPSEDHFETLAVTTPYGRTRLILVRALAVVATCVPVACLLGLALPGPMWVAVAWLGPALSMLPLLLALSSFVGPRIGSAVIAMVWMGVVIASVRRLPDTWPVEVQQQVVYLGVAVVSVLVLMLRSRRTGRIGVLL